MSIAPIEVSILSYVFLVCIFGILSNSLTITVLIKKSKLELPVAILVLMLAFYDLAICCVGCALFVSYILEDAGLYASQCIIYILRPLSIYSTILITVERLVAVRYPHKFKEWFTKKLVVAYSVIVFLYSITLTLVHWVGCKSLKYPKQSYNLYQHTGLSDAIGLLIWFTGFLLPFIILVGSNILLFLEIGKRKSGNLKLSSSEIRDISLAQTFLVAIVVLVVCQTPGVVYQLLQLVDEDIKSDTLQYITVLFIVINTSGNFLIYCVMGKQFRSWTLETLCKPKQDTSHDLITSFPKPLKA